MTALKLRPSALELYPGRGGNQREQRPIFIQQLRNDRQNQYIMMPGGEERQGSVTEWIGEAKQKCYGTSASTAYASGVLAPDIIPTPAQTLLPASGAF
ncbi:MAG TPA: hypothetical protein VKD23_22240 [Terriglobales bacterium]|nr:hypothetical protein [Terriglobales bacterium]